ncbi:MAG TPA: UrcA family protein [Caulobacteraceae bacterium]|jgi:UrcA family protein|nr:UrcA family protein [Caulobacteraceae bacterium]
MSKYLSLSGAIAAAAMFTTTLATGVHAQDDNDAPSVRVSYADLDLSKDSGRATLQARIDHAVGIVCGRQPALLDLDQRAYWNSCRETARKGADWQLAELYRGQRLAVQSVDMKPSR